MRSRLAAGLFGVLLLTGCGSDDACDRPLPYVTSVEGGELVVPDGLNPPPASRQKRIPPVASDRRERSNPCSVGPPTLAVIENREANAETASKNAERSPPSTGVPLNVGQIFKSESVEDTVDAWIASWSAGDAPSYLSYYASDFESKDGDLDREDWLQRRQQMITDSGPSSISIRDVTVEDLPGGRKLVRLIQDFVASDGTKASVVKLIEMTREFDAWRIRREQVVEVLSAN
ncbi:MAG: hypothetical protein AB8G18_09085 [Gammaproteobacteria bacterium]